MPAQINYPYEVGPMLRMYLLDDKCMGDCYDIEAYIWWSGDDSDSYFLLFQT